MWISSVGYIFRMIFKKKYIIFVGLDDYDDDDDDDDDHDAWV